MIKITLTNNDFVITVVTSKQTSQIEIIKRKYNGKYYSSLSFFNNTLILESNDDTIVQTNIAAVFVTVKSVQQKVAELLKNEEVYLLWYKCYT